MNPDRPTEQIVNGGDLQPEVWATRPCPVRLPDALVTQIERLIAAGPRLTERMLVDLLRAVELGDDEVDRISCFHPKHYLRIRLKQTPHFEALMLCWLPGQSSAIHDHAGSICGVRILHGKATELVYRKTADDRLAIADTHGLQTGDVTVSRDADIHRVVNDDSAQRALVTLHLYAPPLRDGHHYDEQKVVT